jgi:hypothetical protein
MRDDGIIVNAQCLIPHRHRECETTADAMVHIFQRLMILGLTYVARQAERSFVVTLILTHITKRQESDLLAGLSLVQDRLKNGKSDFAGGLEVHHPPKLSRELVL